MTAMRFLAAFALLVMSRGATAADKPWALREGFYLAPLYSFASVDSARLTGNGSGYAIAGGYRWSVASFEASLESLALPRSDQQGDAKLTGGAFGVQIAPFQDLRVIDNLYFLGGFGVHARKNHPRFPKDDTSSSLDLGLGYLVPFEVSRFGLALRLEWLYRLDTQPQPVPAGAPTKFEDHLLRVGLQMRFARREPPAAPEPPLPPSKPAITDSDGDGVIDERDDCPGTPPDSLIDKHGCVPEVPAPVAPPPAPPAPVTLATAKVGDTIVLHGVNFEFNRAQLTLNARRLLDEVARQLNDRPELKIEIGGHTDGRGSETYNQKLSEKRAQSVRTYLTEQGVAAERLSAVGYGEGRPIDDNETDEGRQRNRRVELKVLEP